MLSIDQVTVNVFSVDQVTVNVFSADQVTVNVLSVDQVTVNVLSIDQVTVNVYIFIVEEHCKRSLFTYESGHLVKIAILKNFIACK